MNINQHSFGFVVQGYSLNSYDEAWSTFISEFNHYRAYIKGYFYWRVKPEEMTNVCYDSEIKYYQVKARIHSFLIEVKMEEATLESIKEIKLRREK